jgi:hypothetical protein
MAYVVVGDSYAIAGEGRHSFQGPELSFDGSSIYEFTCAGKIVMFKDQPMALESVTGFGNK